jgi:hypothetical protein
MTDKPRHAVCPDCGATMQDSEIANPVRCWLCAYAMTGADVEREVRRAPSRYEKVYRGLNVLVIGFFIIMGIGQLASVFLMDGDAVGLIAYAVFVAIVVAISQFKLRKKTRRGETYGSRDRFLTLVSSIAMTFLIGVLIIVAIIIALFVACITLMSSNFH